jgi:solute carrier family 8 (sodium/calcium exchanger)
VLPKSAHERADEFKVILSDIEGGATFDPDDNGGKDCSIAVVQIAGGEMIHQWAFSGIFDEYFNHDLLRQSWEEWKMQFVGAWWVNGSEDDQKEANLLDHVYHYISLPFQIIFATVPPPSYFGGWATFVIAIGMIGLVTAIIGDLASILGCLINWDDQLTAITIVALGTSLPDTFASKTSAVAEEYADNSIGNVTGSNSVNVFLGLGLPWTLAAFYWKQKLFGDELPAKWIGINDNLEFSYPESDPRFIVIAGDLAFNVTAFLVTAVVALSVIFLRRRFVGAELGGPRGPKIATSFLFILLWVFYVLLSFWKLRNPDAGPREQGAALATGIGGVALIAGVVCTIIHNCFKETDCADSRMSIKQNTGISTE